jgi:protein gp37
VSTITKIEWTDVTWNPLRGCSKVSEGCRNCYAEKMASRFSGEGMPYEGTIENGRWNGQIKFVPDVQDQPLKWKKPRRVFVNSMSDLFHPNVPESYIGSIWDVMARTPQHTYQILTKRPERMLEILSKWAADGWYWRREDGLWCGPLEGPLPNVWLGVSVENQRAADERIPLLLQTPAAVRFLSMEPLLGPVDLSAFKPFDGECYCSDYRCCPRMAKDCPETAIDWVIVGGESGPGARPMHPDWVRSIRDQCQAAGVSFFFKQWGNHIPYSQIPEGFQIGGEQAAELDSYPHGETFIRCSKKEAGRVLDGQTWDEFPVMEK